MNMNEDFLEYRRPLRESPLLERRGKNETASMAVSRVVWVSHTETTKELL